MLNKRFVLVLALVVMALLVMVVPAAQADAPSHDIVVRVFLDANNDVNDHGEAGLAGWTVTLSGVTPRQFATTGPNGFASFTDLDPTATYTVRITPPNGGWRLARANADSNLNGRTKYIVGGAYTIQPGDFEMRVNGDNEAWVRFSTIRVNRITVGGANPGDVIEFTRARDGRLIETRIANQGGWASVVGGGFFYGETFFVTNTTTGEQYEVTIPFGYQPNVNFANNTCNRCG